MVEEKARAESASLWAYSVFCKAEKTKKFDEIEKLVIDVCVSSEKAASLAENFDEVETHAWRSTHARMIAEERKLKAQSQCEVLESKAWDNIVKYQRSPEERKNV